VRRGRELPRSVPARIDGTVIFLAANQSLRQEIALKKILAVDAGLLVTVSSLHTPLFEAVRTTGELESVQK
jgi:hypothetical protein